MATRQSDKEFQAELAKRLQTSLNSQDNHGVGVNANMIMHQPPTGASKSLGNMFEEESAKLSANAAQAGEVNAENNSNAATGSSSPDSSSVSYVIEHIPLSLIDDSPYQPRMRYDESALQSLGALLAADGQNDAVIVRKMPDGRYQLVTGHRRTRAARLIGWTKIAARIVSKDEFQTKTTAYFSNEGDVHLSEYEKAVMYQAAINDGIVKNHGDLVLRTGLSKGRISQIMSLLKLPDQFRAILDDYPDLFGHTIGDEIRKLLVQFPDNIDVILQGVQRLIDFPELSAPDLREFVSRKLRKKPPVIRKPQVVASQTGKEYFAVSASEKRLVIDLKETMDNGMLGKRLLAFLREFADISDADAGKVPKN